MYEDKLNQFLEVFNIGQHRPKFRQLEEYRSAFNAARTAVMVELMK